MKRVLLSLAIAFVAVCAAQAQDQKECCKKECCKKECCKAEKKEKVTVVKIEGDLYTVTAMQETLRLTNLDLLKVGDFVNVERSMLMGGRLDGHIVQGHVDQKAVCIDAHETDGSWYYRFEYESTKEMVERGYFCVDKGSVTINGVSLTVCEPDIKGDKGYVSVCIIPYTFENTNFKYIQPGTVVNLEFDILGKYMARYLSQMSQMNK